MYYINNEAKTFADICTVIYSNQFSLQKEKVRLFNEDYNSIEEYSLEIIIDTNNKNERQTNLQKKNDETNYNCSTL